MTKKKHRYESRVISALTGPHIPCVNKMRVLACFTLSGRFEIRSGLISELIPLGAVKPRGRVTRERSEPCASIFLLRQQAQSVGLLGGKRVSSICLQWQCLLGC